MTYVIHPPHFVTLWLVVQLPLQYPAFFSLPFCIGVPQWLLQSCAAHFNCGFSVTHIPKRIPVYPFVVSIRFYLLSPVVCYLGFSSSYCIPLMLPSFRVTEYFSALKLPLNGSTLSVRE